MASQDRIIDNPEVDAAWAKQVEELSGIAWPPKDDAECTLLLVRAGFTDEQIDRFFDGTLSGRIVSATEGWPTFSMRLIEGLARNKSTADQRLTRILTKREAARLINLGEVENPTDYINGLIKKGMLTPPIGSGHKWQFILGEFPESSRDAAR